jgi:hypothetical protein
MGGAQGPTGATGATGSVSGSQIITVTTTSAANANIGLIQSAVATCPTGKVLLGGGGSATTSNNSPSVYLQRAYPSASNAFTATGALNVTLTASNTFSVTAYAICTQ